MLIITSAIYAPYQFFTIAPQLLAAGTEHAEFVSTAAQTTGDKAVLAQRIAQEIDSAINATCHLSPAGNRPSIKTKIAAAADLRARPAGSDTAAPTRAMGRYASTTAQHAPHFEYNTNGDRQDPDRPYAAHAPIHMSIIKGRT
jgi:hypothetical protein